jgi:ABC-type dipeptide/oligopeptide/nickel transport system permease component
LNRRYDIKIYLVKRILLLLPLLLGTTLFTFILTKALPGDPAVVLVGERASQEVIESIRKELKTDQNFFVQYVGYLSMTLRGELGRSYYSNRRVMDDLILKFPNTLLLAAGAMVIAIPTGLFLGFLSALKRGTGIDRFITSISVIGLSLPVFWSGLMIMLLVSLKLRILPPSGTGDIRFLIMPSITLSLPAIATLTRVSKTTLIEIMEMPFIKTARAKGITENRIRLVHILKNGLIPLVTIIGLDFGSYLNGAVLTETIFGWDGIGRFAMEGIIKRDYPVVIGCILFGTIVYVMINIFVDIIYQYIDPRVRLHGKNE